VYIVYHYTCTCMYSVCRPRNCCFLNFFLYWGYCKCLASVVGPSAKCACIRFCIGDRFYLLDNRILCEYDYVEQRTVQSSSSSSAPSTTLAQPQTQPQPPRSCLDPAGTTPPPPCHGAAAVAAAQMKRHAQLQQQLHQHQQQYLHPHPPHQHAAAMDGCVNW